MEIISLRPMHPGHEVVRVQDLVGHRVALSDQLRIYHGTHPLSNMQSASSIRNIKSVVPLLDRVLVQRFKPETKTASGIFLPSSSNQTPLPEASVIAAGPGATNKDGKLVPTSVQPGDKVLLPSWGGNSIKVGEEVCDRTRSQAGVPLDP